MMKAFYNGDAIPWFRVEVKMMSFGVKWRTDDEARAISTKNFARSCDFYRLHQNKERDDEAVQPPHPMASSLSDTTIRTIATSTQSRHR